MDAAAVCRKNGQREHHREQDNRLDPHANPLFGARLWPASRGMGVVAAGGCYPATLGILHVGRVAPVPCNPPMIILGIETSCDDTGAAIVQDGRILSNIVAAQDVHVEYGGVVPEFASRAHITLLPRVVQQALDTAGVTIEQIDGVAATLGPGLVGSLLVGIELAKGLALARGIPSVGVKHVEAHLVY